VKAQIAALYKFQRPRSKFSRSESRPQLPQPDPSRRRPPQPNFIARLTGIVLQMHTVWCLLSLAETRALHIERLQTSEASLRLKQPRKARRSLGLGKSRSLAPRLERFR